MTVGAVAQGEVPADDQGAGAHLNGMYGVVAPGAADVAARVQRPCRTERQAEGFGAPEPDASDQDRSTDHGLIDEGGAAQVGDLVGGGRDVGGALDGDPVGRVFPGAADRPGPADGIDSIGKGPAAADI